MISKETFVNTMHKLESLEKKMSVVDNAMRDLSPDFGGFYVPEVYDIALNILAEVMGDTKDEWLYYCAYELDWLRRFEFGCVTENEVAVDLSAWDKVYDFLVKNVKEND